MKPEYKAKWLEALRSGEYEQCRHKLHVRDDSGKEMYCCLGVLVGPVLGIQPEELQGNGYPTVYSYLGKGNYLAYEVLEKVGLDWGHALGLAEMNDNGKSFAEIADWIEENL